MVVIVMTTMMVVVGIIEIVVVGSSAASRSEIARYCANAWSATARSPRACATSPTSE